MIRKSVWDVWCTRHADLIHGAFFFACFVVASIAGTHDIPLLSDNQHYFFIAERAASGVPPHISQFDPKNALGMLMTAGAIDIGRHFGFDELLASRLISIAAGALAVGLTWPLARGLTGSTIAGWVASFAMLSLNRFVLMAAMGSQPKIFLVLFVVISVRFVTLRRPALGGLAAGAAFLCWQPALALVAAGTVALLLGGAGRRAAASFLACAVAPFVAYEGYFLYHGVLAEQLAQAFLFPLSYMEKPPTTLRPLLRRAGWVLATAQGLTFWSAVPLLFVVWLGRVWSGWWRRSSAVAREFAGRPDRIYFALGAHAALVNCLLSYQGFPDRFLLDPFMAVAAGWLLASAVARVHTNRIEERLHRVVALASVAGLAVLAVAGHWNFRDLKGLSEQRRLAVAVGRLLDAGFSVYAVGCTHLLAFNHTDNYTPFGFFFRGVAEYLQVRTGGRGYRPLRDGKLPDVILLSRGTYLEEQPWFATEYSRAKRGDFGKQSVQVWLRVRRAPTTVNRGSPGISTDVP